MGTREGIHTRRGVRAKTRERRENCVRASSTLLSSSLSSSLSLHSGPPLTLFVFFCSNVVILCSGTWGIWDVTENDEGDEDVF